MNRNEATSNQQSQRATLSPATHYALLELHPSASSLEIRRAYRELSKRYHPDTTELPPALATTKFQQLNEAYATLSNPERRQAYDRKIGYFRQPVLQPPPHLNRPGSHAYEKNSAYLDPSDRPLSPGELFALFLMGLTLIGCLVLAIGIAILRGEVSLTPSVAPSAPPVLLSTPALQQVSFPKNPH